MCIFRTYFFHSFHFHSLISGQKFTKKVRKTNLNLVSKSQEMYLFAGFILLSAVKKLWKF